MPYIAADIAPDIPPAALLPPTYLFHRTPQDMKALLFLTDEEGHTLRLEISGRQARVLRVLIDKDRSGRGCPEEFRGYLRGDDVPKRVADLVGDVALISLGAVYQYIFTLRDCIEKAGVLRGFRSGVSWDVIESDSRKGYRLGPLGRRLVLLDEAG